VSAEQVRAACHVLGDVALGDGRTLRVARLRERSGVERLVLAMGEGEGRGWREDPAEGLTVPLAALAGLVRALQSER
jgi:hypothetical protein